jgi:hypothetical protein
MPDGTSRFVGIDVAKAELVVAERPGGARGVGSIVARRPVPEG